MSKVHFFATNVPEPKDFPESEDGSENIILHTAL